MDQLILILIFEEKRLSTENGMVTLRDCIDRTVTWKRKIVTSAHRFKSHGSAISGESEILPMVVQIDFQWLLPEVSSVVQFYICGTESPYTPVRT